MYPGEWFPEQCGINSRLPEHVTLDMVRFKKYYRLFGMDGLRCMQKTGRSKIRFPDYELFRLQGLARDQVSKMLPNALENL